VERERGGTGSGDGSGAGSAAGSGAGSAAGSGAGATASDSCTTKTKTILYIVTARESDVQLALELVQPRVIPAPQKQKQFYTSSRRERATLYSERDDIVKHVRLLNTGREKEGERERRERGGIDGAVEEYRFWSWSRFWSWLWSWSRFWAR